MAPTPDMPNRYPRVGEVLDGKYRIEGLLGEGGMSAVMKATHLVRRAPVALKFLSADARRHPGAEERFTNEAVAASRIDSDHVVKIFDVSRLADGTPYLVMEFLEGCDLDTLRQRDGPRLPVARAVHFVLQILRALQTAHAAGIVHRDMKPSNCLILDKDGEADFLKVIDFGISKVQPTEEVAAALTGTNVIVGTPLYMSPEQAQSSRDVDLRTDLYSAGAILYELLSGRTPFTTESGGNILHQLWTGTPDRLETVCPEVPAALAEAVHRALAREPEARFGSAVEMAPALAPFADGRSAAVLGWLLGSRGRSLAPAGFASVRPADPSAVATPEEATAKTALREGAGGSQPPSPKTDTGIARDSGPAPSPRGRAGRYVVAAVAGVVAVGVSGAWIRATHRSPSQGSGDPSASAPGAVGAAMPPAAERSADAPRPEGRIASASPSASLAVSPPLSPPPPPSSFLTPSSSAPPAPPPRAPVSSAATASPPGASTRDDGGSRSRARDDGLR